MATFKFTKLHPDRSISLLDEIEAANARLEQRYPGCTAEIVDADDDRCVAVDFKLRSPDSAACIDWYSAELVGRGVIMEPKPR